MVNDSDDMKTATEWLSEYKAFAKECEDAEYTDTQDAWELLNQAAEIIRAHAKLIDVWIAAKE
jgi:hypothetical protein